MPGVLGPAPGVLPVPSPAAYARRHPTGLTGSPRCPCAHRPPTRAASEQDPPAPGVPLPCLPALLSPARPRAAANCVWRSLFVSPSVCRELPAAPPGPRPPCAHGQGLTRSRWHPLPLAPGLGTLEMAPVCTTPGQGLPSPRWWPRGGAEHAGPLPTPPLSPRRTVERGAGKAASSSWGFWGDTAPLVPALGVPRALCAFS